MPEELNLKASDNVKAQEIFGRMDRGQLKGISATFHLTSLEQCGKLVALAWQTSEQTGLPAIVVVRAPRKV